MSFFRLKSAAIYIKVYIVDTITKVTSLRIKAIFTCPGRDCGMSYTEYVHIYKTIAIML